MGCGLHSGVSQASCTFPTGVGVFCVVCVHCMGGQERVEVSVIIHGHGVLC